MASIINMSLPAQGAEGAGEQENLTPLPPRLSLPCPSQGSQACSEQPAQLPTPHPLSQPLLQARPPEEERLKTKWVTKEPWFS